MTADPLRIAGQMDRSPPEVDDYWRAIILFGRNTASYKFALGKSILELASGGTEVVPLELLAGPFSRHVRAHLKEVDRQATSPRSRFLDACRARNRGELSEDELLARTAELAFVNVIDAFRVVNAAPTPRVSSSTSAPPAVASGSPTTCSVWQRRRDHRSSPARSRLGGVSSRPPGS